MFINKDSQSIPYLYAEAELLSFAHSFYIRQMANSVE